MNSSIAAASLLGFGDQPASQAIQGFTMTLNKMYATQVQSYRGEELSRKAVIDEYNQGQREKKRKEADMMEMFQVPVDLVEGSLGVVVEAVPVVAVE